MVIFHLPKYNKNVLDIYYKAYNKYISKHTEGLLHDFTYRNSFSTDKRASSIPCHVWHFVWYKLCSSYVWIARKLWLLRFIILTKVNVFLIQWLVARLISAETFKQWEIKGKTVLQGSLLPIWLFMICLHYSIVYWSSLWGNCLVISLEKDWWNAMLVLSNFFFNK